MDLNFQKKWVMVFFIIPVFAGIIVFRFIHVPSAIKANSGNNTARISNATGDNHAEGAIASQNEAAKKNKINDFIFPQSRPDSSEAAPRIEAIFISASGKSSIYMLKQFASEGDTIDGFKVLKIYADRADFEKNGKIITAFISAP